MSLELDRFVSIPETGILARRLRDASIPSFLEKIQFLDTGETDRQRRESTLRWPRPISYERGKTKKKKKKKNERKREKQHTVSSSRDLTVLENPVTPVFPCCTGIISTRRSFVDVFSLSKLAFQLRAVKRSEKIPAPA